MLYLAIPFNALENINKRNSESMQLLDGRHLQRTMFESQVISSHIGKIPTQCQTSAVCPPSR